MQEQVDRLVQKTWKRFQELPKSKRLLIAVSGMPGSGKHRTRCPYKTRLTAGVPTQARRRSLPKSPNA